MRELKVINAPDGVSLEFMAEDPTGQGPGQPRMAIAAAVVFGVLAFLALSTAPILLAALVDAGRLSSAALGRVATLEILGIAVGSSFGTGFLGRGGLRLKIVASCLALAGLNALCTHAASSGQIEFLRMLCGLLEGLVLAAATLILTYTRNPERMNGYFLGLTAIPQVAATYLLTSIAIPRFGANVGFALMAAAAIVAALASFGVRAANLRGGTRGGVERLAWGPVALLAILTILLQNAAIGAAFSYIAEVAGHDGVSSGMVGVSMAALQLTSVVGALAVGWFGWRLAHLVALTVGCAAQAGVALALGGHIPPVGYLIACGLFGLLWNALLPFSLKLLIELDPTRRLALLNAPVSLAGLGIGPFIGSLVVQDAYVAPAFMLSAAMFALSACLYMALHVQVRRVRAV